MYLLKRIDNINDKAGAAALQPLIIGKDCIQ